MLGEKWVAIVQLEDPSATPAATPSETDTTATPPPPQPSGPIITIDWTWIALTDSDSISSLSTNNSNSSYISNNHSVHCLLVALYNTLGSANSSTEITSFSVFELKGTTLKYLPELTTGN